MRKILIVNIFGIGDVLFTTPLIRAIRQNVDQSFIGYVGNARTAPVLEEMSELDKVYVYERDEYEALYRKSRIAFLRRLRKDIKSIKGVQYDAVLELSLNPSAGFFMRAAGIKRRIGFDFKGRGRWLTEKIPFEGYEGCHVVEYYLQLAKTIGLEVTDKRMIMPVNDEQAQSARQWIDAQCPNRPLTVGIVPGGGASWGKDAKYKRWPVDYFGRLADKIIDKFQAGIILLGDSSEKDLCNSVATVMSTRPGMAAGEFSILESAALMSQCDLVICNDGGPLHMAVASGTRTVSIFGPVNSEVYGPYPREGHEVITAGVACQPCYRQFRRASCDHISCLSNINVEHAWHRIEPVLQDIQSSLRKA